MKAYSLSQYDHASHFLFLARDVNLQDFDLLKEVASNALRSIGNDARRRAGFRGTLQVAERQKPFEHVDNYSNPELVDGKLSVRLPLSTLETTLDFSGKYIRGTVEHKMSQQGLLLPSPIHLWFSLGSVQSPYLALAKQMLDDLPVNSRELGPLMGYHADCRTGSRILSDLLLHYEPKERKVSSVRPNGIGISG